MSILVIEDGTASSLSANSYITVAELTTFVNLYGLTIPAATLASTTMMEQAILRGMAYVESEFDFKGEKMSYDDPLEWPRYGIYEDDSIDPSLDLLWYQEIPKGLKNAVCRAAYEESVDPGVLQANLVSNIKSERVDVIATEYFSSTPSRTVYRVIEGFLRGLLRNANMANVKRT